MWNCTYDYAVYGDTFLWKQTTSHLYQNDYALECIKYLQLILN